MRNYGRFTTSITRDNEFRALTASQQGLYLMLGLQPEMTAAGVLSLTLRRWAAMSADATPASVKADLDVLHAHGHIVLDEDTEELLIVKFVKFDGGLDNAKRRPVIHEAACAIASKRIRHSLAGELRGIGHTELADKLTDRPPRSDRSAEWVTEGESDPQSLTALPEGEPSVAADGHPPSMFCAKHPDGTEESCGPCGTAKLRYAAYAKAQTRREVDARKARAEAVASCDLCDDKGMRLDPNTRRPLGRCTHQRAKAS